MEKDSDKSKSRPNRCREWERQRRNKFNDAISRLGAVVREINKANSTDNESDNVQYPKVEIVQKAIICLTNCNQERTQLKAEILALQVKLEAENKQKNEDKKDASTQAHITTPKKSQNKKYVKLKMLQKSKRNALKEKSNLTPNNADKPIVNVPKAKEPIVDVKSKKLPKLLPNINNKKGAENTIVVLPAAPYIFPQRPLLFPTVPPAFLLVDPNLQPLNKPTVPIVNRSNGDITKTTMVNILPISAYSRPLSATKNKKNNVKPRNDQTSKKSVIKKPKPAIKFIKKSVVTPEKSKENAEKETTLEDKSQNNKDDALTKPQLKDSEVSISAVEATPTIPNMVLSNNIEDPKTNTEFTDKTPKTKLKENSDVPKVIDVPKCSKTIVITKAVTISNPSSNNEKNAENIENTDKNKSKSTDIPFVKETIIEDKDKENKLPNILDTSLCENVVDGGNARLELAEELLAASPTAAFLMSFPLVSGNRADSPADEPQNTVQPNSVASKDNLQKRTEATPQPISFFEKTNTNNNVKIKPTNKSHNPSILNKQNEQHKLIENNIINKPVEAKVTNAVSVANENPFLNLPMPSLVSTSCTLPDTTFGLDYDCNINKSIPNQSSNYANNSNLFYKSDPFSSVKSTIYSTSSISSGHEFNSLGLYPCAMEKYSKNKADFGNVEENLMKIGSSRLTYDIDLGWSHKSFDFVGCPTTSSNTFTKDNVLTTSTVSYSTAPYNPFNPEFHVSIASNSNKKDNNLNKPSSSFAETLTNFYSQPTNLWSDEVPFYTNNHSSSSKALNPKSQNFPPVESLSSNLNTKPINAKQYETKNATEPDNGIKNTNLGVEHHLPDKYTKKSPSKMHINWMTSEIRPMQNNCNPTHNNNANIKENHKPPYGQLHHVSIKQDHSESNYFPISMHNFPVQHAQVNDEFQVWPAVRPAGTTEISIEPPPINLPTLVGDLALGPHDKKKHADNLNRSVPHTDSQNCTNFLSVTQLMNRSNDNMSSRYQVPNIEATKSVPTKQNVPHFPNDPVRKNMTSRIESHLPQPCYVFNEAKTVNPYENMNHFSQSKPKPSKSDKNSKIQKNSYSAESLIRGGTCTQKLQDNSKFMMPTQKYSDFHSTQDSSIAQVSHFPPILDYSDNSYASQQFSGTTLYNTTTNTISNSFYSNFMPGSTNLMSSNYSSGPFSGEFIDYNQTDCNYTNHKYEELKMRNNPPVFQQDKASSNYKSSRRESAAKHKLDCSKKESSKKYQSKRPKLNTEVEDWNDPSNLLWQNKSHSKRHSNPMSEELPFPNYVGNQVPAQYQPEFFNSHLMPTNMQSVGHNADRSLASFPGTSRANFNLSSIFPEITMKVQ